MMSVYCMYQDSMVTSVDLVVDEAGSQVQKNCMIDDRVMIIRGIGFATGYLKTTG